MSGISLDQQPVPTRTASAARRVALLSFAADKDHLALARMTAMHVAGLAGLPIGRVTDIRLAVDEACALFLTGLTDGTENADSGEWGGAVLTLSFDRHPDHLRIAVTGPAPRRNPDDDDLGWTMLCALVGLPHWEVADGFGTLTFTEPVPVAKAVTKTATKTDVKADAKSDEKADENSEAQAHSNTGATANGSSDGRA